MISTDSDNRKTVGLVETRSVEIELPPEGFRLESGETLPRIQVAYEAYGELSENRDNVVFVCHALSGDAHAAGYHVDDEQPGWWEEMIGPGKGIDTDYYHVICANILGGCKGTTGPSSIDPHTGQPYGSSFPQITVGDMVNVHCLLLKHLGIPRLAAAIGGSFGGMQVMDWAIRYPDMIDRCVCAASAISLSAQALAFDVVGRTAITNDADWQQGDYYGSGKRPEKGLAQARRIGHITYLSPGMMARKFGREKMEEDTGSALGSNFQVESYLDYQGRKFVKRFDANSYLQITSAMDRFDLEEQYGSAVKAFETINAKMLVVALSEDWLFPPEQSMDIAQSLLKAGKSVSYCQLHAPHGHDAFLVDIEHMAEVIRAFMPWVERAAGDRSLSGREANQPDPVSEVPFVPSNQAKAEEYQAVNRMISPDSKVLDLGCGDGTLLSILARQKKIAGIGIDIDINHIIDVIDKGHDVFQSDINTGLSMIPDDAYDCAILSETMPQIHKPRLVLREMLRVADEGIVTFPNFVKWSNRMMFLLRGRTSFERAAVTWFERPDVQLFGLKDFLALCEEDGIRVRDVACLTCDPLGRIMVRLGMRNAGSDRIVVKIARQKQEAQI
jgi:homoserine O-acetyltransferase